MSIKFLVKPENVKTTEHFWDTFGHNETEISARWIVNFLKARNFCLIGDKGWDDFPFAKLESFYHYLLQQPGATFYFNKLHSNTARDSYIHLDSGLVKITDKFVSRIASNPELITSDRDHFICERKYSYAYEQACMK